jgi:hypothetical protein
VPKEPLPIEQIVAMLSEAPGRIAAAAQGLSSQQLRAPESEGEWSVCEVLAHLRACGDMWGGNALTILREDHQTIRGLNPRAWLRRTNYLDLEFEPLFRAYAAQRAALLATLQPLSPAEWQRKATLIDMVGKRLERSVHNYGDSLARHERVHLAQIERIAASLQVSQPPALG